MSIENRLKNLERQNRLFRNILVVAGLVAVAWVTWGHAQAIPDVIKARSFEVTNERGLKTAEFTSTPSGGLIRTFARGTYADSVLIGQNSNGSGVIEIFNKYGVSIFSVDGDGVMILKNRAGEDVVLMGEDSRGHGMLDLYDKGGDFVFQASHQEYGGEVLIYSKVGEIAVKSLVDSDGAGRMEVCDPDKNRCNVFESNP